MSVKEEPSFPFALMIMSVKINLQGTEQLSIDTIAKGYYDCA